VQQEEKYPPQHVSDVYGLMRDYTDMDSASASEAIKADSAEVVAFMKTVSERPFEPSLAEGWANSRAVEAFTPTVDSVFGGVGEIEQILGHILGKANEHGLELPLRRYAAVVYDRPKSILFVDSVMLIALNHYLGEDFPGYSHWPYFMRRTKNPETLPYDIAEALTATSYPFKNKKADVLSRIIYEGVLAKAKTTLTNDGDPAAALGYDKETWQWLLDHESALWHSLVTTHALYDTSQTTIDKLVSPTAQISILKPTAPGRAGRFIGYRIVEAYTGKHPEMTLPQLLSPTFYNNPAVLIESGYRP